MKTIGVLCLLVIGFVLGGCKSNSHTLKVAATSVPHAEILEEIKPDLAKNGIDLEIIVVEDFNTPNRALEDKEVDANFFQHRPFLELQMKDFDYHLVSYADIHIEPMGIYSKKIHKLNELQAGSSIAIPSDPSNQARALCLLQQVKLVVLKQCSSTTSVLDIEENPSSLKIIEVDSPLLSRSLDDVQLALITTNFALQAGLSPKADAIALEDAKSLFTNVLVIRKDEESRQDLQALKSALTSQKVREFILKKYQGAIVPAF